MQYTEVAYYNGIVAKPFFVRVETTHAGIQIMDAADYAAQVLYFPFTDCNYVVLNNQAFVYLDQQSSQYLVLPLHHPLYIAIVDGIRATQNGWYHRLLKQQWYVLMGIVLLLFGSFYLFFDKAVPAIALSMISVKQEISMGDKFYTSFTQNEDIDSTATFILQQFADNLTLSDQYPIHVTVLKDTIVNAFALPGGHLVVYTGILKQMEKPEELVALLGHESSHVNQRHSLKSLLSRISTSIFISFLSKDISGFSQGLINNVNMLKVLHYSRALETEADNEGMKLMVRNHVNPIGMKFLMEDLLKLDKELPSSLSFMSTHPLTKERLKNAEDFSKSYISMPDGLNDSMQSLWRALKHND